jgi:hypothetical protein
MHAIFSRRPARTGVIAVAIAAMTLVGAAAQAATVTTASAAAVAHATPADTQAGTMDPCPTATTTEASCAMAISTPSEAAVAATTAAKTATGNADQTTASTTTPAGLTPADLQQAYDLPSPTSGSGQTVALVTPYGDPDAASDLASYRSEYGLSPCTVADGCFKQVSETGTSTLPGTSGTWDASEAASVDIISAICPNCHILVVEATSASITDLGTAENEAVSLGAKFIDNDWYVYESASETTYDTEYFDHPGVAITAPSGDGTGYGVTYPAASQYVIAVGGTTLTADSSSPRMYDETAWADSGSGCSQYEPKPSWQTDTGCTTRTLNDLSADAGTAVSFYDTPTEAGWGTATGTLISSAIIAATYALAGIPGSSDYPAEYPYEHPGGAYTTPGSAYTSATGLNNITSGSNGVCSVTYLCTAATGYNGPTGLGTPDSALSLTSGGTQSGHLYNGAAGMCMDDTSQGTTAGNPVQAFNCLSDANQDWTTRANGTITYDTSYCLSLAGNGTTSGTKAELDTCASGNAGQQWGTRANDEIENPASGLCLTNPDGTTNGTQLDITACAATADQTWTIQPVRPASTGAITSKITSSKCIDDTSDATSNGNDIQIWDCLGDSAQDWEIQSTGVIMLNGETGCLTASNDGTTNGTPIVYYSCDGDPSQHWIEHSDGSLVNQRSGLCLADPDANDTDGTVLQLSPCNSEVQQTWTLP